MKYGVTILTAVAVMGVLGAGCNKDKAEPVAKPAAAQTAKPAAAQTAKPAVEKPAAEKKAPAWIKEYFGDKLVLADGSTVSSSSVAGKTVGIYFSAHWCPPCRGFTPQLVKVYNELQKSGKDFDIVFVSSDHSAEAMAGYMKDMKMPWKGLPYGIDKKQFLKGKYSVRGIPTLVIVDSNGKTVSQNGRLDVMNKGAAAFDGWTK